MSANDTRVWAPSNTGTKAHVFLGSRGAKPGNLRAACRVTIQRSTDAVFVDLDQARKIYIVCDSCVKLYAEAEARADHSMRPATESDDLGYVAPVDERTERTENESTETPEDESTENESTETPEDESTEDESTETLQCTCECTWNCERPADEPCACPCVCRAAPAAGSHAGLSTEDLS